ncbi:MAG: glycolate oxidase iron-sulfur subunit, partial [Alphaproteobacteria bacterium]|nr:glycolate oxidase iron-sulfur subunit [Alphaproteobacteria bacterium]
VLPRPWLFRLSLVGAWLAKPAAAFMPKRLGAMLRLAPAGLSRRSPVDQPRIFPAEGARRLRVALLAGCAQTVLAPQINEATIRLLNRLGCDVAVAPGAGCCGSLAHHMGRTDESHEAAAANIKAWLALWDGRGPERVVINTSGCGVTVKNYGHMLRTDPLWSAPAARVSAIARDVSELVSELGLPGSHRPNVPSMTVAYHSACALQHGQKITSTPKDLLAAAGYKVTDIPEAHLCCGSAGTYNLLEPDIAEKLRDRKVANIERVRPDVIAAGNIGCMTQIASGTRVPVVHTVELLDWATGGPRPPALTQAPG